MLRLVFFAVPFALLFWIGWPWWLALIVAALVGVSLSVIFLSKQRTTASSSIYEWRMQKRTSDDIAEDEATDAAEAAVAGAEQQVLSADAAEERISDSGAAENPGSGTAKA